MRIILLALTATLALAQSSRLDQAKAMYEAGKLAEARAAFRSVKKGEAQYAAAQYGLGRIAYDEEQYDDAADFFQEAISANDQVALYHQWLGDTYGTIARDANMIRQGILAPKMKKAWERAIALDANNIDARLSLIEYYMQAPSIMGGSPEKAIEMALQIKKINVVEGHRALGNVYFRQKKIAEAEREFVALAKADPRTRIGLAQFYINQGKFDQAFALLEEMAKENSGDMGAIYQIGKTSALSGQRLERGEECLRRYLAYTPQGDEPSHAGAHMRLAQVMEKKGNKTEAKRYYQLALNKDKSLKEAQEGLERVSR